MNNEYAMLMFRKMCVESLDPETYEMSEKVEKVLRKTRSDLDNYSSSKLEELIVQCVSACDETTQIPKEAMEIFDNYK